MGTGALNPRLKQPGREADHSSPSSAEVKKARSCTSTLPCVFMAWCLFKHRDNFTFIVLLIRTSTTVLGGRIWSRLVVHIIITKWLWWLQNYEDIWKLFVLRIWVHFPTFVYISPWFWICVFVVSWNGNYVVAVGSLEGKRVPRCVPVHPTFCSVV